MAKQALEGLLYIVHRYYTVLQASLQTCGQKHLVQRKKEFRVSYDNLAYKTQYTKKQPPMHRKECWRMLEDIFSHTSCAIQLLSSHILYKWLQFAIPLVAKEGSTARRSKDSLQDFAHNLCSFLVSFQKLLTLFTLRLNPVVFIEKLRKELLLV